MSAPQLGPGVEGLPPRPGGGGSGGGASGIEFTDGTNTVNGSIKLTVTGATVGGSTPDATLTVTTQPQQWTAGDVDTIGSGLTLITSSITWNPADKASIITLSGGNNTASVGSGSSQGIVRATSSVTTGKWYFEQEFVTVADGQNFYFGIANASESLSNFVGDTDNSIGTKPHGEIIFDNSGVGSITAFSAGGTCDCAFDADAKLIWFRSPTDGLWNGSGTANPATGTGGISFGALTGAVFPATSMNENSGAQSGTIHLSSGSFVHTPPAGFNPYSGGGVLEATSTGNTFQSSNVTSGISVSANTPTDVTSLNLEAGSWLIFGNVGVAPGTPNSYIAVWTSETPTTLPGVTNASFSEQSQSSADIDALTMACGVQVVVLASPATVYLGVQMSIAGTATGYLGAQPLN